MAQQGQRKYRTKTSAIGGSAGFVLLPRNVFQQLMLCTNQLSRHATPIGVSGGGIGAGVGSATQRRRGRPPAQNVIA
jgi:hypothetical protein